MARCCKRCPSVDSSWTDQQKWLALKYRLPYDYILEECRVDDFNNDYLEWQIWNALHPTHTFERWLRWRLTVGTASLGNLPGHKINSHVGETHFPCPYSTQSSDENSLSLLGFVPAKVDHTLNGKIYYMRPQFSGEWGRECTFDNCPYKIANGQRYFYV